MLCYVSDCAGNAAVFPSAFCHSWVWDRFAQLTHLEELYNQCQGVLVAGYGNSGQLSSVELLGDSFSSSLCKIPDLSSPLKRHLAIHTKDDQV